MSTVHLITGPTGAGKTTYTHQLAAAQNAIYFSIDAWMQTLFAPDRDGDVQLNWMLERIERCETLIWEMSRQLLAQNKEVILDLGFSKFEHREKFRRLAKREGNAVLLHFVTAPREKRKARVVDRNNRRPETFSIEVTDELFNFMEEWFEEPNPEELANGKIVNTHSS